MTRIELTDYVDRQLGHFFPDGAATKDTIRRSIDDATDRLDFSLRHVKLHGYTAFSVRHSDLYAKFLYLLSNTIWKTGHGREVAEKLFCLNKALHGLNCMFDTELPDIFLLIHCVGCVLGKASYSNYFVACQNVTVGSDRGKSPVMRGPVYMGPGSSLIGDADVLAFAHLGIGSTVLHTRIPEHTLVVPKPGGIEFKQMRRNLITDVYFKYSNVNGHAGSEPV